MEGSSDENLTLGEVLSFVSTWRRTIGVVMLLVTTAVAAYTLTRTPTFEASATLVLERPGEQRGVLSELTSLTSAPAAERELAILSSRSLAEEVARDPQAWALQEALFQPTAAYDPRLDAPLAQGLATRGRAEDTSLLASLGAALRGNDRGGHRLFATVEARPGATGKELRVSFPAPDRVRVSTVGWFGTAAGGARELPYAPGEVVECFDTRLRLAAVGDYVGRAYRVSRVPLDRAVEDLLRRTRVRETVRGSGVLRLTVEDDDPRRAAEVANALVRGYIARSVAIGGLRATKTAEFLESELERVSDLLERAERDVVGVSAEHSRAINITASSEAIIDRLASYDAERARMRVTRVALEEARELVAAGQYEALARLANDLPDALSLGYLDAIAKLTTDAVQLERSDGSAYKGLVQQKLLDLRSVRDRSSARVDALRRALEALAGGERGALAELVQTGGEGGTDATAERYLEEIVRLDSELAGLAPRVTEKHPEFRSKVAARATLLEQLREHLSRRVRGLEFALEAHVEVERAWQDRIDAWPEEERSRITRAVAELAVRVAANIESQVAGIADRLSALEELTRELEQELVGLPESERALAEPMRRRESYAEIMRILMRGHQEAQLSRASTLPSAVLVDPAIPPDHRIRPRLVLNMLSSLVGSFFLGLGLAWLRSELGGEMRTQAEVEAATGLAVLGAVPVFRSAGIRSSRADFLPVRDDPHGPAAEAFRSLRESLRFVADDERPVRSIAAISCTPGEGKTVTNLDLALAVASEEHRVLIVDADMRRPRVAAIFDLPSGPGLVEVLEGHTPWRDAVADTGRAGLEVLQAGRPGAQAEHLLRKERLGTLLDELVEEYDLVVFDTPPTLAVADVESFARRLDGVVLVVRAGRTPARLATAAVERLRRAGVNVLGAVLNGVHPRSRGVPPCYEGYGYMEPPQSFRRSAS